MDLREVGTDDFQCSLEMVIIDSFGLFPVQPIPSTLQNRAGGTGVDGRVLVLQVPCKCSVPGFCLWRVHLDA
jgi:hypothetical protein